MEFFKKAKAVRFRSHHNKYLLAGDDEESIWQDRDGTVKNAKWTVEINESGNAIRLKSCYGKYLTASNMPGLLGMKSKKVVQTLPKSLDCSVEWEPIREGTFKMRLKMAGHGQFLRANGGVPPWRNSITHDTAHRCAAKDWVSWDVEVVEICMDQFLAPKETTSDGVETNDDDSQQADTPSEIDVTSPPPPPSKHSSETKKNRRPGVRANDLYSYFSMCTCQTDYHKKGSKSS